MTKNSRWARLDQLLSNLGYCTRSEVKYWIKKKRVTHLHGELLKSEQRIDPSLLLIDGKGLDHPEGILVLFHKPAGFVCSHADTDGPSVFSFFPEQWLRRSPKFVSVGRLDKDTTGLLLLTDQHDCVQKWTSPKKHVTKIYEFSFENKLITDAAEIVASGKLLLKNEAKPCKPAKLILKEKNQGTLEISEGRYHQVKRMIAALGGQVTKLHRSQFGEFHLGDLKPGEYRHLPIKS